MVDHPLQLGRALGFVEGGGELGNDAPDTDQVHSFAVEAQEAFYVLLVLRSPRYGLVDHQIFGPSNGYPDVSDQELV